MRRGKALLDNHAKNGYDSKYEKTVGRKWLKRFAQEEELGGYYRDFSKRPPYEYPSFRSPDTFRINA